MCTVGLYICIKFKGSVGPVFHQTLSGPVSLLPGVVPESLAYHMPGRSLLFLVAPAIWHAHAKHLCTRLEVAAKDAML